MELTVHLLAKNGTAPVPSTLNAVVKKIRSDFGESDLKLLDVSRLLAGAPGGVNYRGSVPALVSADARPNSLDWALSSLSTSSISAREFSTNSFTASFGTNAPIGVDVVGKVVSQFQRYDVTAQKATFSDGVPKLAASITVPGPTGRLFFIVTVQSAGR